jgi:hypothetical protein
MPESPLHLRMKEFASRELEREGYSIFAEPAWAPSRFLTWRGYRPDLFGMIFGGGRQDYVIVECETRPSEKKLSAKNFLSVSIQSRLDSRLSLRRILVVPRGTLGRVDSSVRYMWETWIFEGSGFQVFPAALSCTA